MADNRTMAQMLQTPIEGYEDAIVVPQINANNFELKQTLINLVQSNQFTGRQDPHNHLRFFNKVTSTFRHPEVPNTTIKLLRFPFSLEGEARIWLDKEPPRSILTWEDLKLNETFDEAWERFKDLLRQCPHHGFSERKFLDKIPRECLSIVESKSNQIAASLEDKLDIHMNRFEKSLNDMKNSFVTPTAPLKAVEEDFQKTFEQKQDDFQNQMMNFMQNLYNNKPSSSSSLPSNTIPNLKGEAKAITTRSGMTYKEPPIPPPGVEEQEPKEETTDTELPSTEDIQPPLVQEDKPIEEPSIIIPKAKANLPYPSRLVKEKIREKDDILAAKFVEIFREVLGFSDVANEVSTLCFEPIVSNSSQNLTPFDESDFLLFEEVDAFLAVDNEPILPEFDATYYDPEGDILILDALLNSDPEPPLPNQKHYFPEAHNDLKVVEPKNNKSFDDEPPEVELKELPPHLEYAFLCENNKWPVIIAKDLSINEKSALIDVLKSRKKAIAWKLTDIRGYFQIPIDPKDQEKTTFTCPYGTFAFKRMPFGLCNAPGTFQRCMMAIFHDMIEQTMEFFMDDFLVFGNSFPTCLTNLEKMLKRCEDTKLALNWEKNYFMVKEGKIDRSSDSHCSELDQPFELMCDASDYVAGAVLGKKVEKHFRSIHYASKTMTQAETNYTTTEKEMLEVVYTFEKFRSYLIMNKSIVYTDHSALKYLFAKKDAKARLLRWILLLQEFDFKFIDTKGAVNYAADHLSRLENPYENVFDPKEINETFPLES
nr:retrovirus-related Pol polyprotein from transposon 17.6 [Tanacetum cinerariifolium]